MRLRSYWQIGSPLATLLFLGLMGAQASAVETYGELFLVEEIEDSASPLRLRTSYANELSNSFQNISEAQFFASYSVRPYLAIGARYSLYWADDKEFTQELRDSLELGGFRQEFLVPTQSAIFMTSLRPLSGRLNFFQSRSVQFNVWNHFGYGQTFYDETDNQETLVWELELESFLTKSVGAHLGIGQDIEAPFAGDVLYKTKVKLGCSVLF